MDKYMVYSLYISNEHFFRKIRKYLRYNGSKTKIRETFIYSIYFECIVLYFYIVLYRVWEYIENSQDTMENLKVNWNEVNYTFISRARTV